MNRSAVVKRFALLLSDVLYPVGDLLERSGSSLKHAAAMLQHAATPRAVTGPGPVWRKVKPWSEDVSSA